MKPSRANIAKVNFVTGNLENQNENMSIYPVNPDVLLSLFFKFKFLGIAIQTKLQKHQYTVFIEPYFLDYMQVWSKDG